MALAGSRLPSTTLRRLGPYLRSSSLHTSRSTNATLSHIHDERPLASALSLPSVEVPAQKTPDLSCLPLSQVLRTYFIAALSSSPWLLSACSRTILSMLDSKSWLTDVEKNPILNLALRETFYKQFCAGNDKETIGKHVEQLQKTGVDAVILEYAREVLKDTAGSNEAEDIKVWRKGVLASIDMCRPGDFIGLKWSGMGTKALQLLKNHSDPTQLMASAMHEVCAAAAEKSISLLPSAEETNTLTTLDAWSLSLQRQYNRKRDTALIYNTYQAYLRSTPLTISAHLADASRNDYMLGVKIVRGAYLASEQRDLIWPTKAATDEAYDQAATACMQGAYTPFISSTSGSQMFPKISLLLATHNLDSARAAIALRRRLVAEGKEVPPLVFAQLQGMADEVTCELLGAEGREEAGAGFKVIKCSAWGSMEECLNYLLRRAAENKDAAGRTRDSRLAMGAEIRRRMGATFGLA